jgi:hypothetical protein
MQEQFIKRNDIVSVLNYSTGPDRITHYIGKVLGIDMGNGTMVNEYTFTLGMGPLNTKEKIKVKVKPCFKIAKNSFIFDSQVPEVVGDDLIYLEKVYNVTVFTPERYEEMRIQFLTKLNVLSNLLFNRDEMRVDKLVVKPKPFNLNEVENNT